MPLWALAPKSKLSLGGKVSLQPFFPSEMRKLCTAFVLDRWYWSPLAVKGCQQPHQQAGFIQTMSLPRGVGGAELWGRAALQCPERCLLSRHKWALERFHLLDKAIVLNCASQSTEFFVSVFHKFRSMTKLLAYINLIRLEYCIINHF